MEKSEFDNIAHRDAFHFWHIGRREILVRHIARFIPKSQEHLVLDVGCGPGGNIGILKPFGRVTGLDQSTYGLSYAKDKGYEKLLEGDLLNLPFPDESFDMVSSLDVFEHIQDDTTAMRECMRVLKAGGILVATAPAHPFLWNEHDLRLHHVRRYASREIKQKVAGASLRVLFFSHFLTLGVPGILARNTLKLLRPSRAKSDVYSEDSGPILNAFFLFVMRIEQRLMRFISLPFGSSLLIIAKKPKTIRDPQ